MGDLDLVTFSVFFFEGLCVVGTLLLIYNRFRPLSGWTKALNAVWWSIIVAGLITAGVLAYATIVFTEGWETVMVYVTMLAFLPLFFASVIALFFKPRRGIPPRS